MGAWIEIACSGIIFSCRSVAPYMGAWIEINREENLINAHNGRSLHGSVD